MPAKRYARLVLSISIGLCSLFILSQTATASGSDEKSPADQVAEREKEATKKYNNGVKHMKKATLIAQVGDSAFAFNYRATSDAKAGKELEKAIKDFKKAISLRPEFAEAYNNLGYCYRKTGELEQSLAAHDQAIGIDSGFAQAREYRGETYLALGDLSGASSELEYLKNIKSSYADTLAFAITLYRLAEINRKTETGASKKN